VTADAAVKSALLFSPITIRGVTFPNRIVIAPMQMYTRCSGQTANQECASHSHAPSSLGIHLTYQRRGLPASTAESPKNILSTLARAAAFSQALHGRDVEKSVAPDRSSLPKRF